MDTQTKLPRLILLLLGAFALTGCVLGGSPIEGQVLDIETKKPMPGAIVMVEWVGQHNAFVDSQTSCYHVVTATTDSEGRYRTPKWRGELYGPFFTTDSNPGIIAYKPGYTWLPPDYSRKEHQIIREDYEKHILYVEPFKGTRGQRLTELVEILGPTRACGSKDGSQRNLHALYSAMYEEAKNIAVTKEDSEKVETLRRWASIVIQEKTEPVGR